MAFTLLTFSFFLIKSITYPLPHWVFVMPNVTIYKNEILNSAPPMGVRTKSWTLTHRD